MLLVGRLMTKSRQETGGARRSAGSIDSLDGRSKSKACPKVARLIASNYSPPNFFRSIYPPPSKFFETLPFAMQILRARIIERVASSRARASNSPYWLDLDADTFKIAFLLGAGLAITARYRPHYRLPHEARSLRNRLCDDDDHDASLHLRAYLLRLLSISSIFLLRNVSTEETRMEKRG